MATAPLRLRRKEGRLIAYPVKASTKIYEGDFVVLDSGASPLTASTSSGAVYVGIAAESVDNSAGALGAEQVLVWCSGVFEVPHNSGSAPTLGAEVHVDYETSTQQVRLAAPAGTGRRVLKAGRCVKTGTSVSQVRIDGHALREIVSVNP